jgi:hypothetical protein
MDEIVLAVRLLLLLAAANTAPLVAKRLLGTRWAWPLDGGRRFVDGRPLLGSSKTYRGVLAAIVFCVLVAAALRVPIAAAVVLALAAMAGDAISSFVKRRLAIPPSGQAFGLDQLPEALLPLLAVRGLLDVPWLVIVGATIAFVLLEPPLAQLTHHLGLRDQPY